MYNKIIMNPNKNKTLYVCAPKYISLYISAGFICSENKRSRSKEKHPRLISHWKYFCCHSFRRHLPVCVIAGVVRLFSKKVKALLMFAYKPQLKQAGEVSRGWFLSSHSLHTESALPPLKTHRTAETHPHHFPTIPLSVQM